MRRILQIVPLSLVVVACVSGQDLSYSSPFFRVTLAADQPNFTELAVDSLGKAKLDLNVMLPLQAPASPYTTIREGSRVGYRTAGGKGPAVWSFEFNEQRIS